jgi:hypothetical protein
LFYAIGNSHLDLEWVWTVEETKRKSARTLGNQLELIKRYPDYKYIQSQAWILDNVKKNYPELYERVKEAVKSGNIIIEGGSILVAASADKATAFKPTKRLLINGGTLMGIGAKESVPATASTQAFQRHTGITVVGGSPLTVGGVTFTIPSIYSNNGAYILVSSPNM